MCAERICADGGFRQDRGLFPRSHGTERGWSFRNAVVQGKRCGVREAPDSRWRGKPNTGPFLVGQAHGMKAGKFFMVSAKRGPGRSCSGWRGCRSSERTNRGPCSQCHDKHDGHWRDRESHECCHGRKVCLLHRDRINEFIIRPLKLFRSKSLEVAFRNPSTRNPAGAVNESSFVSSEQAFKMCFKKTCWPDPCRELDIVLIRNSFPLAHGHVQWLRRHLVAFFILVFFSCRWDATVALRTPAQHGLSDAQ